MPKVTYSSTAGLQQTTGAGVDLGGHALTNSKQIVVNLTGAGASVSLTSAQTGAVIFWGGSNASTATLPAVSSGLRYTFVAATAHAHVLNGGATVMNGQYLHSANKGTVAHVAISAKSSLTMHGTSAIGDRVDVWCDGTSWLVEGVVNNTITQA